MVFRVLVNRPNKTWHGSQDLCKRERATVGNDVILIEEENRTNLRLATASAYLNACLKLVTREAIQSLDS